MEVYCCFDYVLVSLLAVMSILLLKSRSMCTNFVTGLRIAAMWCFVAQAPW